jgi:hypothetical protein
MMDRVLRFFEKDEGYCYSFKDIMSDLKFIILSLIIIYAGISVYGLGTAQFSSITVIAVGGVALVMTLLNIGLGVYLSFTRN